MFFLIGAYLCVIKNGGKFMKGRSPFKIESIIVGYNIFQIIANLALFALVSYQ